MIGNEDAGVAAKADLLATLRDYAETGREIVAIGGPDAHHEYAIYLAPDMFALLGLNHWNGYPVECGFKMPAGSASFRNITLGGRLA